MYSIEINPSGQYDWIEHVTGLPISAAICDFLMGDERRLNHERIIATAVTDVLDYLLALQHEGVRPQRPTNPPSRLCAAAIPSLGIDLLAEEEAFDQSVHYDALLRLAGNGTVSLSYCPERAIPGRYAACTAGTMANWCGSTPNPSRGHRDWRASISFGTTLRLIERLVNHVRNSGRT